MGGLSLNLKLLKQAAVREILGASSPAAAAGVLDLSLYSSLDGSGLSRHDLVTPSFLASLLAFADQDYIHLLPLAGRSGSLADRFIGPPAEGILYAKTGVPCFF